jgi:hypothetical protein
LQQHDIHRTAGLSLALYKGGDTLEAGRAVCNLGRQDIDGEDMQLTALDHIRTADVPFRGGRGVGGKEVYDQRANDADSEVMHRRSHGCIPFYADR